MIQHRDPYAPAWSARWAQLAHGAGLRSGEKLLVALSGGADSVLLLHLAAAGTPPDELRAVHVHHGLRGAEADADARFCERLCRSLGVTYAQRRIRLEAAGPSLEARARRARYRALAREALASGHRTVLTGHHRDDALEGLLLRWTRGSGPAGAHGPYRRLELDADRLAGRDPGSAAGSGRTLSVVRPLLPLRREEVRRLLADRGLGWREDRSNQDRRHTRNVVRHGLLPLVRGIGGQAALEELSSFARAVEDFEDALARQTAHVAWSVPPYAAASRGPEDRGLGGCLPRRELMVLVRPLRRRVLWRLLLEGTGRAPGRFLVERILDDLGGGRCTRHALSGRWTLLLQSDELHLLPPPTRRARKALEPEPRGAAQAVLPFPGGLAARAGAFPGEEGRPSLPLDVPGIITLCDGRRISAEVREADAAAPVRRSADEVELDATGLPGRLVVRWPRRGDRFHGLGAPGSKRLCRFLADRGIPREERAWVPLVFADEELIWVSGVQPGESRRIRPTTRRRLRLTLHRGS